MDPTYFPRNREPLCGFAAVRKVPEEPLVSRNMFLFLNLRLVSRPLPFVGINRRPGRGLIWIRRISLETGSRSAALQLFKKVPAEPPVSGNMFREMNVAPEEPPVSKNTLSRDKRGSGGAPLFLKIRFAR
jgi:hypothetical protein